MNFTRNRIAVVGGGFGGLFTALNLAGCCPREPAEYADLFVI
jgi:NADH dehydrogenase FAD-containing subunit